MDPDDATWFELPRTAFESLVVRPIFPDEHAEWNRLMAAHHYLGFRAIVGESLRYVAVLNNRWVALMGWGAAALKSRHREAFVGWHPQLQWKRLSLITNNVRFLILPGVRLKNLASKVLAMNTRRLSADWQTVHGHPVLMAETFVDDRLFAGTCYRAAGWLPLGQTRGFKRNGGKYYSNDVPKTIWVRLLVPNACRLLADPVPQPELLPTEVAMNLDAVALETSGGLLEYLNNVPDFRKKRGIRHRLLSVLAVAVCAILSGARSYAAMGQWAQNTSQKIRQRLGCRYHKKLQCFVAPSEPTLRRAIQQVEAESLEQAVSAWLTAQVNIVGQAIAIDGRPCAEQKTKTATRLTCFRLFSTTRVSCSPSVKYQAKVTRSQP